MESFDDAKTPVHHRVVMDLTGPALGLFGYSLIAGAAVLLVIPAAWGIAALAAWFWRNVTFSNGTKASFEGRAGEVWLYGVLGVVVGWAGLLGARLLGGKDPGLMTSIAVGLVLLPISTAINLRLARWGFAGVRLSCGTPLRFTGEYLPYLGWNVLVQLSIYTVIGWAWVSVAFYRWLCRNITAEGSQVEFRASGWGLLWRGFAAVFACLPVVSIPWVIRWLFRWLIQNVEVHKPAERAPDAATM